MSLNTLKKKNRLSLKSKSLQNVLILQESGKGINSILLAQNSLMEEKKVTKESEVKSLKYLMKKKG